MAMQSLDQKLIEAQKNKKSLNIELLIYNFNKLYPVSEKALRKQIGLFIKTRDCRVEGDDIIFS